jgi:hypothetical protein
MYPFLGNVILELGYRCYKRSKTRSKKEGNKGKPNLAAARGCPVVYALYDPGTSSGRAFNSARHMNTF